MKAQKAVVFAGVVLGGMVLVTHLKGKNQGDSYKQLWAAGLLILALSFIADFAPEIAVPVAVAVVVGYAIRNKGALGGFVGLQYDTTPKGKGPQGPVGRPGQPLP